MDPNAPKNISLESLFRLDQLRFDPASVQDYWLGQTNDALKTLILPREGKSHWTGAALVLCELDDARFVQLLPDLLVWVQDMNWPGAEIVFDRVKAISAEYVARRLAILEAVLQQAKDDHDEEWVDNLIALRSEL